VALRLVTPEAMTYGNDSPQREAYLLRKFMLEISLNLW